MQSANWVTCLRNDGRSEINIAGSQPFVLAAGRLMQKGFDLLLAGFKLANIDWNMIILGDGPDL